MALIEKKYGFRIVIDFILLLIVAVPILLFYLIGSPFERGFFCDDSIWYPYKDSTISSLVLYFVGTLLPASMILILEYVRCRQEPVGKRTLMCGRTVPPYLWALYCNIGVFLFGCACSQLLTDVAKYSIGRLRPHFLEVCNPDWSKINCSVPGLYIYPECHPKDEFRLKEARLSFPSGHASFSAFTMVYLALYLQARMHIRIRLVRPALQFAAILIAFYTALSRVSDYKHHWSDVLFGSLLGTTVAFAVWYSVLPPSLPHTSISTHHSWLPLMEHRELQQQQTVGHHKSRKSTTEEEEELYQQQLHQQELRQEHLRLQQQGMGALPHPPRHHNTHTTSTNNTPCQSAVPPHHRHSPGALDGGTHSSVYAVLSDGGPVYGGAALH